MKSIQMIYDITAEFGQEDSDRLRRMLISLRTQVKNEILYHSRQTIFKINKLYEKV